MKTCRTRLIAALFGVLALGVTGSALAHHDHDGPPGHAWGHYKHQRYYAQPVYYPAPVFVRPAVPVMVPAPVYYAPTYYYPAPRRSSSLVIGVTIPLR